MRGDKSNYNFGSMIDNIRRTQDASHLHREDNIDANEIPNDMPALDAQLKALKGSIQRNAWLIGQRLHYIITHHLHLEMGYDSFARYVEAELDFQERSAFKYIAVARNFDYAEAERISTEKLAILAQVQDPGVRKKLLERTQNEALSVRKLALEIRNMKELQAPAEAQTKTNDTMNTFNYRKLRNNKVRLFVDLPQETPEEDLNNIQKSLQKALARHGLKP